MKNTDEFITLLCRHPELKDEVWKILTQGKILKENKNKKEQI